MSDSPTLTTDRTTVRLDPMAVAKLFAETDRSMEGVLALYKMVTPDWDRVESLDGYPTCNDRTWQAICKMIIECDKRRNLQLPFDKQFFSGGIWINSGFSTLSSGGLVDWEVLPVAPEKIKYKE